MRWDQTEYLLKGVYLGLLLAVALHEPGWPEVGLVAACTAGGLALSLAWAGWKRARAGVSVRGHVAGFLLFLLLENPRAVFTGLVGGLTLGAYLVVRGLEPQQQSLLFAGPVLGGAALGMLLAYLRSIRDPVARNYAGLALAVALAGGGVAALWYYPLPAERLTMLGALLLLGIPGFYLLTFVSLAEESEMEMAALCAALGVGLWALSAQAAPVVQPAALLLPLAVYYVYIRNVLPGLRVFKHALRGLSYHQVGQYDRALASLGRALQLNPQHPLAREQLWDLHRKLDFRQIQQQPSILAHINYELCLERVAALLLADRPQEPQIQESLHLLELVAHQRPDLEPMVRYWRAVAACHQRKPDEAATDLDALLAGTAPGDPRARRRVLFPAWRLALLLHPQMRSRVGEPLVQQSARRFEAIGAVERELAAPTAADAEAAAWDLKRLLYSPLTEAMYLEQVPEGKVAEHFDYNYVREMGLALLEQPDQWQRGAELLRVAACGLPLSAATLYTQIARAHEKAGDRAGMWANYSQAMALGRQAGVANLAPDDRKHLFAEVKAVGDRALAENQVDTALEAFKFYSQKDEAGIETYRTLAELFERKKDVWNALHCTEHALSYNAADPDLLARKDRYYYSIAPDDLRGRWEQVSRWFDVDYCLTKAQWLLDKGGGDLDLLDWGAHLAELLGTVRPSSLTALLLRARVRRLRGETPEAIELLEKIRQNKPEKFASEAEEDAWYVAHRLLGDLYLDEKPAEAVGCFLEFRKSSRAGADTMYKLGRAYEGIGDLARAARCYEEVTTFTEHPLYYEARDALDRVRRGKVPR